jgi:hypothetical protein
VFQKEKVLTKKRTKGKKTQRRKEKDLGNEEERSKIWKKQEKN